MTVEGGLIIYKGRTHIFEWTLAHQIGDDVYTSQIRAGRSKYTPLIATWNITVKPGANNRTLIFSLDDAITGAITRNIGWTDLKRVSGGEPLPVLDFAIPVEFRDTVTA